MPTNAKPKMTDDEYFAHPAWSQSDLRAWMKDRHAALADVEAREQGMYEPRAGTDAMAFGTAVHRAILEPNEFTRIYRAAPVMDRRTAAGKAAWAEEQEESATNGQLLLSASDYSDVLRCAEAALSHDYAADIIHSCLENDLAEHAVITESEGLLCKAKLDLWPMDAVYDVKTTRSIPDFALSVVKYDYALQAAHYMAMAGAKKFYWILLDRAGQCAVVQCDDDLIAEASARRSEAIRLILREANGKRIDKAYKAAFKPDVVRLADLPRLYS